MAVWRAHGLDSIMRECWEAGVVLAGWSAGSPCWHCGGPTDSFGDSLAVFTGGLGFLPYRNGVHDSLGDQPRRRVYRESVAMQDGARAWRVEPSPDGGYHDEPIPPRRL